MKCNLCEYKQGQRHSNFTSGSTHDSHTLFTFDPLGQVRCHFKNRIFLQFHWRLTLTIFFQTLFCITSYNVYTEWPIKHNFIRKLFICLIPKMVEMQSLNIHRLQQNSFFQWHNMKWCLYIKPLYSKNVSEGKFSAQERWATTKF